MQTILGEIQAHHVIAALVAYYVFSSVVGGMPTPDDKSGAGYKWAYNTLHILAGNLARIPQVRSLIGTDGK